MTQGGTKSSEARALAHSTTHHNLRPAPMLVDLLLP